MLHRYIKKNLALTTHRYFTWFISDNATLLIIMIFFHKKKTLQQSPNLGMPVKSYKSLFG